MKHSATKETFRIFAIISDTSDGNPLIFVGKTIQKNLKTVLRYYRKKKYYTTVLFEEGSNTRICCLEIFVGTRENAYRLVLAYMRYFLDADFDVVSHYIPYEACLDLHEEAQKHYNRIESIPVTELLSDENVSGDVMPSIAKAVRNRVPLTARLSIRVTEEEHRRFSEFCKQYKLSQRDAILSLFGQTDALEALPAKRIREQANLIDWQRQYIRKLDLAFRNGSRGANADKKLIEAIFLVKKCINQYLKQTLDYDDFLETLCCLSWKQFVRACPTWKSYDYPQQTECFYFRLHYLCYGKSSTPCIFLYGQDSFTGEKIRMRFYDKREYIGPHPNRSPYFCENAQFLVMCKQDEHKVADMMICLPLPPHTDTDSASAKDFSAESIDDIIREATERSV